MEYPFIMESYTPTKDGDAVYERRIINNQFEAENFRNEFSHMHIRSLEMPSNYLDDASRLTIVKRIKDRVPIEHAVSVINSLVRLRDELTSKDKNLFFRIDAPLIESISMQAIQDERFDRNKSENDYYITFKKKETNTPNISVGGDFHGNLNTGTVGGNQSLEMDFSSPLIHNTRNSNPANPKIRSAIEMLSWVFGIIVALLFIYEFILKHIFHTQSLFN